MIDSDTVARIYAQVAAGKVTKDESPFVTDDETAAMWDTLQAEVDQAREANPQVQFDVPNEVPDVEGVPTQDPAVATAEDDSAYVDPGQGG